MTGQKIGQRQVHGPNDKARGHLKARFSPTAIWTSGSSADVTRSTATIEVSTSTNGPQTTGYSFSSTNSSSTSFSSTVVTPAHAIVTNSPSFVATRSSMPPTTQSAGFNAIDAGNKATDFSLDGGAIMGIVAATLLASMAVITVIAVICRKRNMKARIHRRNTLRPFGTGAKGFILQRPDSDDTSSDMRTQKYGYAGGYDLSSLTTIATPAQSFFSANADYDAISHRASTITTGRAPLNPITPDRESRSGHSSDWDVNSMIQHSTPSSASNLPRFDPTLSRPIPDGIDGQTQRWTDVWRSIDHDIYGARENATRKGSATSGFSYSQSSPFAPIPITRPAGDGRATSPIKFSVAVAHRAAPPPSAARHSLHSLTPSMFTTYDSEAHHEHSEMGFVGYPYGNQYEEFRKDSFDLVPMSTYLHEFPLPPCGPPTTHSGHAF